MVVKLRSGSDVQVGGAIEIGTGLTLSQSVDGLPKLEADIAPGTVIYVESDAQPTPVGSDTIHFGSGFTVVDSGGEAVVSYTPSVGIADVTGLQSALDAKMVTDFSNATGQLATDHGGAGTDLSAVAGKRLMYMDEASPASVSFVAEALSDGQVLTWVNGPSWTTPNYPAAPTADGRFVQRWGGTAEWKESTWGLPEAVGTGYLKHDGTIGGTAVWDALQISDVSGLQTALDGKAASGHSHQFSDLSNVAVPQIAQTQPAENELLAFNASTNEWENRTRLEADVADRNHNHNTLYYTQTQVNTLFTNHENAADPHTQYYKSGDSITAASVDVTGALDVAGDITDGAYRYPKIWVQSTQPSGAVAGDLWVVT